MPYPLFMHANFLPVCLNGLSLLCRHACASSKVRLGNEHGKCSDEGVIGRNGDVCYSYAQYRNGQSYIYQRLCNNCEVRGSAGFLLHYPFSIVTPLISLSL